MRWIIACDAQGHPCRLALDAEGSLWLERGGPSERLGERLTATATLKNPDRRGKPREVVLSIGGEHFSSLDLETVAAWFPGLVAEPKRWSAQRIGWTLLGAILVLVFSLLFLLVPWLGDKLGRMVSPELEAELQTSVLASLPSQGFSESTIASDQQDHYQRLFHDVLSTAGVTQPYRLLIRQHAEANAFATPGGLIVFTDPIIPLLRSDAAFIAVLAHELGHLEHRHVMRQLGRQSALAMAMALLSGDASGMPSLGDQMTSHLLSTSFSREFEREADAFAFDLLVARRISPMVLAGFLERLSESHGGATLPSMLSTHPLTAERIRAAEQATRTAPEALELP